jgi:DNA-binding transcriptional MocR family regulator
MWRRAFREAGRRAPSAWPDFAGLAELRGEVAGYLRRARALVAAPEQILITRGVTSGLALLAGEVLRPGDRVGVEEPGYEVARAVLARAGAVVVPCRADAHGLVPGELPQDLRMVYTTPAHQYPLGGRLPVARRRALIAWARATGALIIEDDYDSEFRYDVAPLPSLYGMDPEVVVYLGTTSKILTPALGTGWLVGPAELMATLAGRRGDRPAEPVQQAVLSMLRAGDLERHVRKMRLEYARRRAVVVETLRDSGRLLGDTAGLHVVLQLPDRDAATRVRYAAARKHVSVRGLDEYFAGPPSVHGLVIGYGAASLPEIREAATVLRELLLADGGGERRPDVDVRIWSWGLGHPGHRDQVRAGEPVDVDGAGSEALAFRHLRRAEVPALSPPPAGPLPGQLAGGGGRPGRPAARHVPRVQPAEYRGEPRQRTVGERFVRPGEHAELGADPAVGADRNDLVKYAVTAPAQALGSAERAAGPQDGDELRDIAGHRVPDQVTRPAFGQESLGGRLDRHRARPGTQRQPHSSRCAASQGSPVGLRPDAFHAWHPCVCHRLPLLSV